jgi:hypothetical protein
MRMLFIILLKAILKERKYVYPVAEKGQWRTEGGV